MSDLMSAKDLGTLIFRARYKKGLTRPELAQQIGKTADYVNKVESGVIKKPSPQTLLAICKALDLDIDNLLDMLLK